MQMSENRAEVQCFDLRFPDNGGIIEIKNAIYRRMMIGAGFLDYKYVYDPIEQMEREKKYHHSKIHSNSRKYYYFFIVNHSYTK